MLYSDYRENNVFNFWNNKKLNTNLCFELFYKNNIFLTYTPPSDVENIEIFNKFLGDKIQNPNFFFHELFPLLKFSSISFIFVYPDIMEGFGLIDSCTNMIIVFDDKLSLKSDCYNFENLDGDYIEESTLNTAITSFLNTVEPNYTVNIKDNFEDGSFFECISNMKRQALENGLYFPSGFSENIPQLKDDYNPKEFSNKKLLDERYEIVSTELYDFFLDLIKIRFPGQVDLFEIKIIEEYDELTDNEKKNRITLQDFNQLVPSENSRFIVLETILETRVIEKINSHSIKIVIDRKFKKIIVLDPMVNISQTFSLRDLKQKLSDVLEEKKIIDLKNYKIVESIVSYVENEEELYGSDDENEIYDEDEIYDENKDNDENEIAEEYYESDEEDGLDEISKHYEQNNFEVFYEGPIEVGIKYKQMFLQFVFEKLNYKRYCVFISWWMLFILLKQNEYNWNSFTQVAGRDLITTLQKNPHFIGYVAFLVIKTIRDPEYMTAKAENNSAKIIEIIRRHFLVKNVFYPNSPVSKFGSDCKNKI